MNWYTGDTHAFHANIIKYSKRPFENAYEMNAVMAANINERVKPNDWLYHLGDWSFGPKSDKIQLKHAFIFRKLIACKNVVLIFGNHDHLRRNKDFCGLFRQTADILEVKDQIVNEKIVLCHYGMRVWCASHHGRWHLYGHSHGHLPDIADALCFDVGVDCHDYKPLSSHDVAEIMQPKIAARKKRLENNPNKIDSPSIRGEVDATHHGRYS